MTTFLDMFSSHFLLHNALWGSIAVGLFCPILGVYFMVRRLVLLGIALPPISTAGVACIFWLQSIGLSWSLHPGEANDRFFALIGSLVFTLGALVWFSFLERKSSVTAEGRLGAAYAIASAVSILFVAGNASAKMEILNLLNGELVSISGRDLYYLIGLYAVLGIVFVIGNRNFMLVSFDRETAAVLGRSVWGWNAGLFAALGLGISLSVLVVGPMMTFGALIIPPLVARRFSRTLKVFFALSSGIGAFCGLAGFFLSYRWDWPLAPTTICVSGAVLALSVLVRGGWDRLLILRRRNG